MEEQHTPVQEAPREEVVAVPKKKSSVGKIIALIFGSLLVCCFVAGFLIYSVWNGVQNGPQATSVKMVWQALDTGDEATVKKYSDELVYSDLVEANEEGIRSIDIIKGSNIRITIANVSVDIDAGTAEVYYVLTADKNQDVLSAVNYATLKKVGETWIVTYLGSKEAPTDTSDTSLDEY